MNYQKSVNWARSFFPALCEYISGIRGVDKKLFDVARILEFSRLKQVTKLILPAALPIFY